MIYILISFLIQRSCLFLFILNRLFTFAFRLHLIQSVVRSLSVILKEKNGILYMVLWYFHLAQHIPPKFLIAKITGYYSIVNVFLEALYSQQFLLGQKIKYGPNDERVHHVGGQDSDSLSSFLVMFF